MCMDFNPFGHMLAAGCRDGAVKFFTRARPGDEDAAGFFNSLFLDLLALRD